MGADGVREQDGQKLAFEMDCPNGRYIKDKDMCLVFASDMAAVGIDVTVNVLDWSVFIDHASSQGAGFPTMHLIGSGPGFNCRSDLGYIEANTGSYSASSPRACTSRRRRRARSSTLASK